MNPNWGVRLEKVEEKKFEEIPRLKIFFLEMPRFIQFFFFTGYYMA